MSEYRPSVFLVDDDAGLRESLRWLLGSVDLPVLAYASGQEFLERYPAGARGCVLLDVRMPGGSGLSLLEDLRRRGMDLPVLFISGHADVPMVVQAFRSGAADFIEKPFHDQTLLDSIQRALERDRAQYHAQRYRESVRARVASLTPRELDVFVPLAEGMSTRDIAEALGISPKTVEAYRIRVMRRLGARNLSELVRMAITAGELAEEVPD